MARAARIRRERERPPEWPAESVCGEDGKPLPFHEAQRLAWISEADIVAFVAGSGGGKTSWAPWWMDREVKRRGRGDYLAVTASYDLFKVKLLPAYLMVFCDILKTGRYWAVDRIIELRQSPTDKFMAERSQDTMWGRIILRSAQSPGGLESSTAKAVHADEAGQPDFGLDAWRAISRRVYSTGGRVLVTTTLYNLGWLKQQLIDPLVANVKTETFAAKQGEILLTSGIVGARSVDLIQFDSVVNPSFSKKSWDDAIATMADDEFNMFFRGRVAKLRSLVYDVFDPAVHVCDPIEIPLHWPRYVGIDPFGDRIAATWWAWDHDHMKLHCYREYCEPFGLTTAGHAHNILTLSADEPILGWIGGGPTERQSRTDWEAAGIPLQEPSVTDVWTQIQRAYSLFKTNSILIHSTCEGLISELQSMRRKKLGDEYTMEIENKGLFHCADSMRYILAQLATPAAQQEIIYNPERIE